MIERRGRPAAGLRPLTLKRTQVKLPDMARFWTQFPKVPGDGGRFLEEDR